MATPQFPSPPSPYTLRAEKELEDPRRLQAFQTLKAAIKDVDLADFEDDVNVYRFLKARDFNAEKAEKMIRDHVKWRRENKIDELMQSYKLPQVLAKYFPGGFCGVDKEGQPVWYSPSGRIDSAGLWRSLSREEMLRSRIYFCELFQRDILPRVRRETGLPVYACTFVVDLQHFGRRHVRSSDMQLQSELMQICERNYPETMGNSYIINVPKIFPVLFNLWKPFMAPETVRKVHLLGKNYLDELLQRIDVDQIPVVYGGTKRAPDDACSDLICWGGTVPQSLYKQLVNPELLDLVTVKRRSKFRKEVTVGRVDEFVEWEFSTEDGDLGFSLIHEDGTTLVSFGKVSCSLCPAGGGARCRRPGRVVATFDNSSSWTSSKKLNFYVRVVDRPSLPEIDSLCHIMGADAGTQDEEKFQQDIDELLGAEED